MTRNTETDTTEELFDELTEGDEVHVHGTGEGTTHHVVEDVTDRHGKRVTLRRTEGRGTTITLSEGVTGGVIMSYDARNVRLEPVEADESGDGDDDDDDETVVDVYHRKFSDEDGDRHETGADLGMGYEWALDHDADPADDDVYADAYEQAGTVTLDDDAEGVEAARDAYQAWERGENRDMGEVRSMAVGDVLVVDSQAWFVDSIGFEALSAFGALDDTSDAASCPNCGSGDDAHEVVARPSAETSVERSLPDRVFECNDCGAEFADGQR